MSSGFYAIATKYRHPCVNGGALVIDAIAALAKLKEVG